MAREMDSMNFAERFEGLLKDFIRDIMTGPETPDVRDLVATDTLGDVLEKFIVLHVRVWNLEDAAGLAETDEEFIRLQRKINYCFKVIRPRLIYAINMMLAEVIGENRMDYVTDHPVKLYGGFEE